MSGWLIAAAALITVDVAGLAVLRATLTRGEPCGCRMLPNEWRPCPRHAGPS